MVMQKYTLICDYTSRKNPLTLFGGFSVRNQRGGIQYHRHHRQHDELRPDVIHCTSLQNHRLHRRHEERHRIGIVKVRRPLWHALYRREDTAEHHKEDEQEKDDEHGLQLVGCHAGDTRW